MIGRPPYLYFLLFRTSHPLDTGDWKTAVLLLPFTENFPTSEIGRLPYLYFLLLGTKWLSGKRDWKTAVFILPFTANVKALQRLRLEDCRIYTSFYFVLSILASVQIGRLPYYYFLLLGRARREYEDDWKTAVLLLPSTYAVCAVRLLGLEDCRITTSFYSEPCSLHRKRIGRLPYYYFLLLLPSTFR